jgi:hypothetical protein
MTRKWTNSLISLCIRNFNAIFILIQILFITINCSFIYKKKSIPQTESYPSYRLFVDFPDRKEIYTLREDSSSNELSDILANFSLNQDPSMRFVTTNQTIEVFDIMGTRNNFQFAWRLYIDYKELSWKELKKGKYISTNQMIQLKFLPVRNSLLIQE